MLEVVIAGEGPAQVAPLHLKFQRIQFTPDLMPADLIGTNVVLETPEGHRKFEFQPGPVFANLILADEINRATPKTQSALLEAMQERSVTVAGKTHNLGRPFFVLATQNPLEMEVIACPVRFPIRPKTTPSRRC